MFGIGLFANVCSENFKVQNPLPIKAVGAVREPPQRRDKEGKAVVGAINELPPFPLIAAAG
jgi:hypothetical protein